MKKYIIFLFLIFIFALTTVWHFSYLNKISAVSGDIYVDNTAAAGGNGSLTFPYNTIQGALNVATSGANVIIRGDSASRIYSETPNFIAAGTSTALITLKSYPGEKVIISHASSILLDQNYTIIDGGAGRGLIFDHQNAASDAFKIKATNITVRNIEARNGAREGFVIENASAITIEDSYIHNFFWVSGTTRNDAHCIMIDTGISSTINNIKINRNTIERCSGDGTQIFGNTGDPISGYAKNIEFVGNTFIEGTTAAETGLTENALDLKAGDTVLIKDNIMSGYKNNKTIVVQKGSRNITIEHNEIRNGLSGIEMRVEGGASFVQINQKIIGNVIHHMSSYALKFAGVSNATVINNTITNNASQSFLFDNTLASSIDGGIIKNNLMYSNGAASSTTYLTSVDVGYNGWFQSGTGGLSRTTDTTGTDPLFTNISIGDYHLLSGSPAINKGTNVGLAFSGTAPDLGAFEFDSGSPPPPDTTPPVVSSVTASALSSSGTTIAWTTNEASDTQVEYGSTASYGSTSALVAAFVTAHSQALSGLSTNTLYHYRVKSRDAAGNLAVSPDFTFTTLGTPPAAITATVETAPVPHTGDAADDPAIWVHPTNPSLSTIIGTDKLGGIAVYDLSGNQLQFLPDGNMNNVDLRYNFPLGGQNVTLVTAGNRTNNSIAMYKVNPTTRLLENAAARIITTIATYGSCMYRSAVTGKFYYFVNATTGVVEQWELFDNGLGLVDAAMLRTFDVGTQTEGCVVDDAAGQFYIGEETVGIWRYGAEPSAGMARISVASVGTTLVADVEGLTIAYYSDGTKHLFASSQGDSSFIIYAINGDTYAFVKKFQIAGGTIDGTNDTDGIDVSTVNLGTAFPSGVFVAQDGTNSVGNQNYKLVPLNSILAPLPPLSAGTYLFTAGGDHGTVAQATSGMNMLAALNPSFYLALGDMSYSSPGTETAWCNFVKSKFTGPFEIVSGNHEDNDGADNNGSIANFAACLPDRLNSIGTYGSQYYFDFQNLARVIMISPNLTIGTTLHQYTAGSAFYNWLSAAIDDARIKNIPWVIVGMHENCITMGTKTCTITADVFNLLVAKKVDLILEAHDHTYQRSKQLKHSALCSAIAANSYNSSCVSDAGADNAYTKNNGPVLLINGIFGRSNYTVNTADTEAGYFATWAGNSATPAYGFMKYTISSTQIAAQFVNTSGAAFSDNFAITAASSDTTPPSAPTGLTVN